MRKVTQNITPNIPVSNGVSDVRHGLFAVNCDIAFEPPTKGILPEASSAGHSNPQLYTLNSQLYTPNSQLDSPQTKPELGI